MLAHGSARGRQTQDASIGHIVAQPPTRQLAGAIDHASRPYGHSAWTGKRGGARFQVDLKGSDGAGSRLAIGSSERWRTLLMQARATICWRSPPQREPKAYRGFFVPGAAAAAGARNSASLLRNHWLLARGAAPVQRTW